MVSSFWRQGIIHHLWRRVFICRYLKLLLQCWFRLTLLVQGYPQSMRLQRQLYRINTVCYRNWVAIIIKAHKKDIFMAEYLIYPMGTLNLKSFMSFLQSHPLWVTTPTPPPPTLTRLRLTFNWNQDFFQVVRFLWIFARHSRELKMLLGIYSEIFFHNSSFNDFCLNVPRPCKYNFKQENTYK